MNQLQDLYEYLNKASMSGMSERSANHVSAAIAIVKQMMQAEPIYQYQMADGSWVDQIQASYEYNKRHAPNAIVRVLFAAPQGVPVWFPIETAPKDGTEVIVITKELGALVMFWDMYHPNAMWSTGLGADEMTPTHWMPLPAPPKEAA